MARELLKVGESAPDFDLPMANGERVKLHDLISSKPIVLYFYPKDETPGCTAEACNFRDAHEGFVAAGATVIGVSKDSVASHAAFAQRHSLPFKLLSDQDGAVAAAYGVGSSFFGLMPGRVTFVIDQSGIVRDVFSSQIRTGKHVERALQTVRQLASMHH